MPGFTPPTEDPERRLILLGTVHTDPRGFSRTRAFFLEYEPDLILVELSPFSLQYRIEHARTLRKTVFCNLRKVAEKLRLDFRTVLRNAHVAGIILQIGLPFEYRASTAYAKHSGVKVVPVDNSEFSMEWITTWPELTSSANIENLLQLGGPVIPVTQHYQQAARAIAGESSGSDIWGAGDFPSWQEREDYIAAQIRSQLQINQSSRPVYIGGWRHLVSKGRLKTIRDILGLEESSCLLLDRALTAD